MSEFLAALRGSIYEGLALAFGPPSAGFYQTLQSKLLSPLKKLEGVLGRRDLKDARVLAGFVEEVLQQCSSRRAPDLLTSLKAEYHRLFVGPYKLPAAPYASVYLEPVGAVMGASTLEVLMKYEQAGFFLSPSFRDLPDHVAVELEFMALLCEEEKEAWKREDFSQALTLLSREETFLRKHLTQWIPSFSSRILRSTESPFYQALASLVRAYVLLDADCVGALRGLLEAERAATPIKVGTRDGD